ncbi:MAG: hypothetical protein M3303_12540, partial [Gemmatimonadota bacterium]|nr:hypothetical protein [Gemmatimonadota bacterium]
MRELDLRPPFLAPPFRAPPRFLAAIGQLSVIGVILPTDPPVDRRAWRSLVLTRSPYTASMRRVKLALQRAMLVVAVDG